MYISILLHIVNLEFSLATNFTRIEVKRKEVKQSKAKRSNTKQNVTKTENQKSSSFVDNNYCL